MADRKPIRVVVASTCSEYDARHWRCSLDCGHEVSVLCVAPPKRAGCPTCSRIEATRCLAPCPFCGSTNVEYTDCVMIMYNKCQAQGPPTLFAGREEEDIDLAREAADHWNTRVTPSPERRGR